MSKKRSSAPASFVPSEETAFVVEQQTNSSHECEAGDVVQPGESCTYPGTNLVFSVSSSGTGSLGFVSAGTRIEMINTTLNGVVISFVAEKQEDNSWLILRVGDDIHDPDADTTPTVALALDSSSIDEDGGVATVTATLSEAASADVEVSVAVSPGSRTSSSDYTLSSNTTLTIAAGQTTSTGTVTVTAVDNDVDAPNKTLTVSGAASGAGVSNPSSRTLTIIDDDEAPPAPVVPTVTLSLGSSAVDEDGGVATVTATLSEAASAAVTVSVSVSPDSGASSSDYTLSSNTTLTIAAGETTSTGTVTITAVDNDDDAANKTVTVSGTASGGGVSNPSSQTLTITDDDEAPEPSDDFSEDTSTTGTVAVDGSVTGEIEESGATQRYRVELKAGQSYRIEVMGSDTGQGTLPDPGLRGIYGPDGALIEGSGDDDSGRGRNSSVVFTPESDGSYEIAVEGRLAGAGTGTYTLVVSEYADDHPAMPEASAAVEVGGSAAGSIGESGDTDWFRVLLRAGETYRIDLEGRGAGESSLELPFIEGIYDADGNPLPDEQAEGVGDVHADSVTFTPGADGMYFISAAGAHGETGDYLLTIDGDDYLSNTQTPGVVTVGGSASGEIEASGDEDWFRVTLKAGERYTFELEAQVDEGGSQPAPHVDAVYDADGNQVANLAAGTDGNRQRTFTPDADGAYYLAVAGQPGAYRLVAGIHDDSEDASALVDDYPTGVRTVQERWLVIDLSTGSSRIEIRTRYILQVYQAGRVEAGGSAIGNIERAGDVDFFRVSLEAGKTYQISLEGADANRGTLEDPNLHGVWSNTRSPTAYAGTRDDDSHDSGIGRNSVLLFRPEQDTTVQVRVESGQGTGSYTLSVAEYADDIADTTKTDATVEAGGSAIGEIGGPDEEDWFRVALKAGQTYRIDLEGKDTDAGTLENPLLAGIYDAEGKLIEGSGDDDGGVGANSVVLFTPDSDGTYYVSAAGQSETGTYTLSVAEYADDFAATVETAGTVEVGGSATGEIGGPDEEDWFRVALKAGQTYRIDLEGKDTDAGTLENPLLAGIYDAGGKLIEGAGDDDSGAGANSAVLFTPDSDGTYYVSAAGQSETGTYTLSVAEHAEDAVGPGEDAVATAETEHGGDFAATAQTAGVVEVGGSLVGEIGAGGDEDWWRVTLEAGKTYRVDLEGEATEAGTLNNPRLAGIYDADGERIEGTADNNDGVGNNSRVAFTPDADGVYYIAAASQYSSQGTYTLTVGSDDFAATAQTAGVVEVGGSLVGEIGAGGDEDWWRVTLEAGKTYRVDLEGEATEAGTLNNPRLAGIYDADGERIEGTADNDDGVGNNSRVAFTPDADGVYYIAAASQYSSQGTYTLTVGSDDFAATAQTAGVVEVGGSLVGEIGAGGDEDWWRVTLEAGKTYRVDLEGEATEAGTLNNPRLAGIYDADGERIEGTADNDDGVGNNSRVAFTPDADGVYYIAAASQYSSQGTYTLSVIRDRLTATVDTTGVVEVGASVAGRIEFRNDEDWIRVTLDAGKTYRIDLEGAATDAGTLYNPRLLGIYDADGDLIKDTGDDDGGIGNNSRMAFTPDADGAYYISAAGRYSSQTGAYTLSVAEYVDDFAGGTETAGVVEMDATVTGEIGVRDDQDWFRVTLKAGHAYRFDLEGQATDGGTLDNPYLEGIHDADGKRIMATWDADSGTGNNSRLVFLPDTDGVYYVAAAGQSGGTGTYTLSLSRDDESAAQGARQFIEVGESVTGEIQERASPDSPDRDWFRVTLEAGKTYRIDLEGKDTDGGSLRDPNISYVYDAEGNRIPDTSDNNSGVGLNSRLFYTPDAGGVYYIPAAGRASSDAGTYTLSVVEYVDDFSAAVDTGGAVEVGGTLTGEIGVAGDEDWIRVILEAGKTYRVDLKGAATDAGALSDPLLRSIYDADGNRISGTSDDDSGPGSSSRLAFTPDDAGTYYISAAGRGLYPGAYTLSVEEYVDDFAGTVETTGAVEVGGSAAGEIGVRGDQDWFRVSLKAGETYDIHLPGGGTLTYRRLAGIFDAEGDKIVDGPSSNRATFTPDADGTYYLAVHGGRETGAYTLSVSRDIPATVATEGVVEVGGSVTGEIARRDDEDWFGVTLKAGQEYRIDLEGEDTDAGTLDNPAIRGVYDADGNRISGTSDGNGGVGYNSLVAFTPEADGVYYISAADQYSYRTGTYTLSVSRDISATVATEGVVEVGGSVTGEIGWGSDEDWFGVTLKAGQEYRIDLEGEDTEAGTLDDPRLVGIYDADGELIEGTIDDNDGVGKNSLVAFTPQADGVYYISAGKYQYSYDTGTYTLSVSRDISATVATEGVVEVGGSVTGEIGWGGDEDWFGVTLKAGEEYLIDLEGEDTEAGTLDNPAIRGIYDADGELIEGTSNDNGGAGYNSRLVFTPEADGVHYISAGKYEYSYDTGTYTLSVSRDISAAVATEGVVEVGGSVTGRIGLSDDEDWFRVTLKAGQEYRIDLEGRDTGRGTLADPRLKGIHDADGELIAGTADNDSGAGKNSLLAFTPQADGAYYISAIGSSEGTGTYTLSVSAHTDDFTADSNTAGRVDTGGPVTGEIGLNGDEDWFRVTLQAGKTYAIDLKGADTDSGTLERPWLKGIHDAQGNPIAGASDRDSGAGSNARFVFSPPADGDYFISAAQAPLSESLGTYTLAVAEYSDDFSADADTAGVVSAGGSTTGEIGANNDRDWFRVTLEAGQPYLIDLEGVDTEAGTLEAPYIPGIYDAGGNSIAGAGDRGSGVGTNSRVAFTPESDGAYYIAVDGWGETGTYTLSVRFGDIPDTVDAAHPVEVGGSITSEIEDPNDRDWFRVALEAGKSYRIDLKGLDSGSGALEDPRLVGVYSQTGEWIAGTGNNDSGAGADARDVFSPTADGAYYISAGGSWDATGTYRLLVEEYTDDFAAAVETAGQVAAGGSASGEIGHSGDHDWFAVTLKAGQAYRIDLEGEDTGGGTLQDALLFGVYDAFGNPIAGTQNDNGGTGANSRLVFTPDADGVYYISVAGRFGETGTYTLSVAREASAAGAPAEASGPADGSHYADDAGGQGGVSVVDAAEYFSHLDGFGEMEDFFESFVHAADAGIDGA